MLKTDKRQKIEEIKLNVENDIYNQKNLNEASRNRNAS